MLRLSDTAIEIINDLHTERLEYASEYIPLIDAANRLADYEDTGLEPEEIADFMKRWELAAEIAGLCKKEGIDHLLELKKAEQDGRLVVLPCKVGDMAADIGKTVFLTREEAEAALQKGDKDHV